jgi:UDP-N-acetylmuramyl pentapeptide phosphotransferase/UDP-N-acetylglucosamine-1-phosphate transferase
MLKIFLWGPVVIVILVNIYLSSQPGGSVVLERFPLPFWAGHFTGYAVLTFFLYRALAGGFTRWKSGAAWAAFLIAFIYGILDEFYQGFIPGRDSSHLDVLIDGAGALLALLAARIWISMRQPLDTDSALSGKTSGCQGDLPNNKPTAAGFIIYFVVMLGALFIFPITIKLLSLLLAVTLIFMVGLLDSTAKINRLFILVGQTAAAVILVLLFKATLSADFLGYLARLQEFGLPDVMISLLLVSWVVFMTNSFNLTKGLDGLAAGTAVAMGSALAVIAFFKLDYLVPALALVILSACLGLFPYNCYPSLVPLGHNGSMLVGFSLASILLLRMDAPLFNSVALGGAMLFVYPGADIILILMQRLFKRRRSADENGSAKLADHNRLKKLKRVIYLICLLGLVGAVYAVFVLRAEAVLPQFLLLALFSVPGFLYLMAMLGLINLNQVD